MLNIVIIITSLKINWLLSFMMKLKTNKLSHIRDIKRMRGYRKNLGIFSGILIEEESKSYPI